ncbi:MAG: carbohydrate kinase family protein, partial [bacterium]
PGANNLFDVTHFDFDHCLAKWLHLGYLLLLEKLDHPDAEFGTYAGRVLRMAKSAGLATSVDLVTAESDAYQRVVVPVLPQVDYFIINEIEAERTTGIKTRSDGSLLKEGVEAAATQLFALGVNRGVVIHFSEGGFAARKDGSKFWQGALALPPDKIRNTTGAGDAFCSGFLYGCYHDWPVQKCLEMAVCCAAGNIGVAASSGGMAIKEANFTLLQKYACRAI